MKNIIFGPIPSRRFGKSLGIDLSPGIKQCNFDCVYCELEPAKTSTHYRKVLPVSEILRAVREGLAEHTDIDVLTVTANGEPTLYPYLAELLAGLQRIKGNTRLLILSNGSTVDRPEIRKILLAFDTVKLSLDCATPRCFKRIDRPTDTVDLDAIKRGMLDFRQEYRGALIVEILVVKGINDKAEEFQALNRYLLDLKPDRIDLGTIDRPPAYSVNPVDYETLRELSLLFDPSLHVHITSRRDIETLSSSSFSEEEILHTLAKRPLTSEDIQLLFDPDSRKRLTKLLKEEKITIRENHGVNFYVLSQNDIDKA